VPILLENKISCSLTIVCASFSDFHKIMFCFGKGVDLRKIDKTFIIGLINFPRLPPPPPPPEADFLKILFRDRIPSALFALSLFQNSSYYKKYVILFPKASTHYKKSLLTKILLFISSFSASIPKNHRFQKWIVFYQQKSIIKQFFPFTFFKSIAIKKLKFLAHAVFLAHYST
jgi:hypothetical protein